MADSANHHSGQFTDEEWAQISEFPDYVISIKGEIKNIKTGKIKKHVVGKRGYPYCSMYKDGKGYSRTIHIMLARTFLPNPLSLPQVNHINGNKLDYSLDNLEWVTAKDNCNHARISGLHTSDGDKKTFQYTKDGRLVAIYKSASEAARANNLSRSNICSVARGNTREKSCGGYIWRYE